MKKRPDIIYFLGIGGIGMSALARYFRSRGLTVYGYDVSSTPLTRQLEAEGMHVHYVDDVSLIPENVTRVIYTPAIPEPNRELRYFKARNIKTEKRAAVIGEISRNLFTIAIAGTHGKTSITAMVAHLLHTAGLPMVAFVGGIAKNFGTNFIISKHPQYMVVEADEYDRSLLTLHPDIGVITSVDADHLDVYSGLEDLQSTFLQFARLLPEKGLLIHQEKLKIFAGEIKNRMSYGTTGDAVLSANNIRLEEGYYCFDIRQNGKQLMLLKIHIPGKHYVENALAAIGVALRLGIGIPVIKRALETFAGVVRRFDYRIRTSERVYIDDYAHHPEELRATFQAVRQSHPGRKITAVFQPHLYSRTRDFADDFARVLSEADCLILLEIYPAREKPVPGITSRLIADKVNLKEKYIMDKKALFAFLKREKPALLLTLGAGDIGLMVREIEEIMMAS
ncbi:MAG: UDP-N-acetylmuramate--L-alanine ligase [bacterium]|nr:MAG: UDP-N-acetylmuramate--L-alanine ligase [bacterium]